jgi:hypothetical protein
MKRLSLSIKLSLLLLLFCSCDSDRLTYIQHVESPDKQFNICLFEDSDFNSVEFHILKIEKDIDPTQLSLRKKIEGNINKKDYDWILDRELINNFEESTTYAKNPKIELIDNRFLVFSRNGRHFALYDFNISKDPFDIRSPWDHWSTQNIWAEKGTDFKTDIKDEKTDYGLWIDKNIHSKIVDYIKTQK